MRGEEARVSTRGPPARLPSDPSFVRMGPFLRRGAGTQNFGDGLADVGGGFYDADAGFSEGFHFFRGGAFAARDDRAGVAHSASGWSSLARDECDDRFRDVALCVLCRVFLGGATDL